MRDTTPKAREVYFERLKAMTPSERVEVAVSLWTAGDSLQRAAMQRKNPQASEDEITYQIALSRFGLELARKAYKKT